MDCVIECRGESRRFNLSMDEETVRRCCEISADAANSGDESLELVRMMLGNNAAEWVSSMGYGEIAMIYAELSAMAQSSRAVKVAEIAAEYAHAV